MTVFFSQLINGLSLGSIYALIALGYSMVYGIILLLNFAHGDVIMVGAYMSWFVMNQLGLGPVTAVCATILTCTLLGVVIEKIAYTPLRSAPRISLLITAIGVSYLLQNAALLLFGSQQMAYPTLVKLGSFSVGGVQVDGITVLTLAAVHTLNIPVDLPTALLLSVVASLCACGASGVPGGSLMLIPLACGLFGIDQNTAMQVVAVGFIIGVLQDSCETALNSSSDALFTIAACYRADRIRAEQEAAKNNCGNN